MARTILKGIPISPGIAIGSLQILPDAIIYEKREILPADCESEIRALDAASRQVCENLEDTLRNVPDSLSEFREIIASQIELAHDHKILSGAKARIRKRKICAAWALHETIEELAALFKSMADPYLCERAQDIRIIGKALGAALGGACHERHENLTGILAAHDLSPADVMKLKLDGIEGILTVEGGHTSHTSILARGLKVPALVGVENFFTEARKDETVILDALAGKIILGPDNADLDFYQRKKWNFDAFEQDAINSATKPARTRDGTEIRVCANIDNSTELAGFSHSGAHGIGLYRTEYSYLSDQLPDEEALYAEYRKVIESIAPARVVFRTLDVGADKILPVQEALHEPNPALGLRGVRFCLQRKDIFATQLRAILRASHEANAAIMIPMISTLQEILETRDFMDHIKKDLDDSGIPHATGLPLGVMVETPAAVMIADVIAANCDFISIGTNDLLHYLLAIDRNNRHVAYLHEPLHPAFIRCLKQVITASHRHGREVSVCGELASDSSGIALLLGLGVDMLSAAPRFVPAIKHTLRKLNASECAKIANMALNEPDTDHTRKILQDTLQSGMDSRMAFHNAII